MTFYWTLGKKFSADHDRAIRFSEQILGLEKLKNGSIQSAGPDTTATWCEKCNAWHVTSTNLKVSEPT